MLSFECDYNNGAHEAVLRRLAETNIQPQSGYGSDDYCQQAKDKLRAAFSCPQADIFFLTGGTQTNAVVLDTYSDAATQELKYIRVVLNDASAEVQNAEYFRCIALYCMKAYQKNLQLDAINQIYNTLNLSDTTTAGVRRVKDKNISYSLTVSETGEAVFTVVYQQ